MWIAISLEAFELTVHFTVRKSCSLRNITWRSHKKDVKERKETSKIVWTTLLYQVDRCFPLTADVQKVAFRDSYLQTVNAESSGSILRERAPRSALYSVFRGRGSENRGPLIGQEFVPLLERWRRYREALLRLKTRLEARAQSWRKTTLLFLFPQTAKTGHNSYIGTF